MAARRDLGPDFEDAVVESFLDKMGQEIDRRVDERLAKAAPQAPARQSTTADGQRLALAIVSLSLGTLATLVLVLTGNRMSYVIPVWICIIIVNVLFNNNRGKG
ncbi:hypothetical protein [Nonomuraea candida]|uniref:hypothetical protein n=1 Tax=Nonomuraea candida TaxID=359159 RepID=UPI000A9240E1|nr:hypothetical protein [Nonomuraea candida]